ncbi:hypothetical protein TNCV_2347891 [Trichonephila clavipes]|uniref:Uncharacterized protein n=1 Tax=Trichonephila clavipes TaxID=2585209 RepID=A0A8X6VKG5_TRICX|nr:hypothetical protein TNCV_2347891 [Trichonephila clavipes]
MQDHIKQNVYGSYSDVGDAKNRNTQSTRQTFRFVTFIFFPGLRNPYVVATRKYIANTVRLQITRNAFLFSHFAISNMHAAEIHIQQSRIRKDYSAR